MNALYNAQPPPEETILKVILTGDTWELQEFFEHVWLFGSEVLLGSYSERDTENLVLLVKSYKKDLESFYQHIEPELVIWPTLEVKEKKEV